MMLFFIIGLVLLVTAIGLAIIGAFRRNKVGWFVAAAAFAMTSNVFLRMVG